MAGRPKTPRLHPSQYHETIIVMMRHGGAVDRMAKDLDIPESTLVQYIRDEGIDQILSRRYWVWKEKRVKRRTVGVYKKRAKK